MQVNGSCQFFAGVILIGLTGCAANVRDEIQLPDPAARVRAIIEAADQNDRHAIPLIVDRLDDEDEAVRSIAAMALRRMTNETFGYQSYDPIHVRQQAVQRWRDWLKEMRIGEAAVSTTTQPAATRAAGAGG
jgi:hypothetical protein